jgi:hypothetical protein
MPLKDDWVTGESFTATDQNAVATAVNRLIDGAVEAYSAAEVSTSSSSYVDLAGTDSVTVTIGPSGRAFVLLTGLLNNSTTSSAYMSFAMSGANTAAASDERAVGAQENLHYGSAYYLLKDLNPGSTTFELKHKSTGGTSTFEHRRITVIPL